MLLNFTFKNNNGLKYNSLEDFGIMMPSKIAIPRAERDIKTIEIEGRDGILTKDTGAYKPIKLPIPCEIINKDLMNTNLDQLFYWLNGKGGILELSQLENKYFKVYYIEPFQNSIEDFEVNVFELNFICDPFKYLSNGNNTITLASQGTLYNPGTANCKPIMKIYGSGNIDLNINNSIIHLINIIDYITIDTPMINAYKDALLQNNLMDGEYPEFIPGINSISWTGTVSKIEIIPNWRSN